MAFEVFEAWIAVWMACCDRSLTYAVAVVARVLVAAIILSACRDCDTLPSIPGDLRAIELVEPDVRQSSGRHARVSYILAQALELVVGEEACGGVEHLVL